MLDCPSKEYGCSCTDNCQSYSSRLAEINRKIKTVQAKRRADRALLTFIACLSIGFAAAGLCAALTDLNKKYELAGRV